MPYDAAVEEVVPLPGGLVDPVDVDGADRMLFVHRQVARRAVDLPGAREHDARRRVVMTQRLEDRQLGPTVDLEVGVGIGHRVEVARLTCEVEHDVLAFHEPPQAVLVAHVRDVDVHPVFEAGDVRPVTSVLRHERVDEHDVRARVDEHARERRADEPEPAGDEHAPAGEGRVGHAARRRTSVSTPGATGNSAIETRSAAPTHRSSSRRASTTRWLVRPP